MNNKIKVVFMGTPSFGLETLSYLHNKENVEISLVVTQPDKIVGRKKEIVFSPIKKYAVDNNLKVFQPENIKKDFEIIKDIEPDIIVTAAYGQILPEKLLNIPKHRCVNLHGSLLPKYRGAAPIQWSLINGDNKTGVTLMYMEKEMDSGDMLAKIEVDINPSDNFATLYSKLGTAAKFLLENCFDNLIAGKLPSLKQNENIVTYARMITREDELLDFDKSSINLFNEVRGLFPNAYVNIDGEALKILESSFELKMHKNEIGSIFVDKNNFAIYAKDGLLKLLKVKPFGKKEMEIKSYINGINKDDYNKKVVNK